MATDRSQIQDLHPFPGPSVPQYRYIWVPIAQNNSMTTNLVSAGGGAAAIGENTTASITGVRFEAATDDHAFLMAFPFDVDVNKAIDARVIWSSDQTTTADSYTWTLKYTELTIGTTSIDTAGATALDTPIAADTNVATASAVQATEYGVINAGSLTGTAPDGYLHTFLLDPDAVGGTIATDIVILYAVEFRYRPRRI